MRKDKLQIGVDYAYWDGEGGFAIPRTGLKAQRAFYKTKRVRVMATDAPVPANEYLIPPKSTGVLFRVLGTDGEEIAQRKDGSAPLTRWQPNARNFAMEWSQFTQLIQPLLDELSAKLKRETHLLTASKLAATIIAKRLDIHTEKVRVDLSEYQSRDGRFSEYVTIYVEADDFADLDRMLKVKIPKRVA